MYIDRFFNISDLIDYKRALIIYGPRRVGKTTLLENFMDKTELNYKLASGDNIKDRQVLGSENFDKIKSFVESYDVFILDEAQKIPKIGTGLKILVDQVPDLHIVATGSSSFDINQKIGEPLTGRKNIITLYPFSQSELLNTIYNNRYELKDDLEEFLIYGSYPEIITTDSKAKKAKKLEELSDSYLLKDVLSLGGVKSPEKIVKLLKLLSFQVGNEVSINELATKVGMDTKTVERYLKILEDGFVIKEVSAFSRNLRNEITKKSKYYFFDNGIRNAVISQFNELENRNDIGALFENFIVMERIKKQEYENIIGNNYFWRTYNQKEIDWIEERDGKLYGYEIKWGDSKPKPPKDFINTYDNAEFKVINKENYLEFIS